MQRAVRVGAASAPERVAALGGNAERLAGRDDEPVGARAAFHGVDEQMDRLAGGRGEHQLLVAVAAGGGGRHAAVSSAAVPDGEEVEVVAQPLEPHVHLGVLGGDEEVGVLGPALVEPGARRVARNVARRAGGEGGVAR